MGNAPPSSRRAATASSSSTPEISSPEKSPTTTTAIGGGDAPPAHFDATTMSGERPAGVDAVASSSAPSSSSSASSSSSSSSSATSGAFSSGFDPSGDFGGVFIQTLGSGGSSGQTTTGDDAGHYYRSNNNNVDAGYGYGYGYGAYNGIASSPPSAGGDALLSSLLRDMAPPALGGGDCRITSVGRLWPGSGRMMRSYRVRARVPRIDRAGEAATATATTTTSALAPSSSSSSSGSAASSSSHCTIVLACKAFVVRSERGEAQLRRALAEGEAELVRLRALLSDPSVHPHALVYARWIVGGGGGGSVASAASIVAQQQQQQQPPSTSPASRNVYLLRQHVHASLADRLVSRPFLAPIEKGWIAYQLLRAIQSLHDAGVCHGHLTTENVLLTSWNWVLIGDVGCQHYKPVALPDDDPGPWIHWFEGRGGGGSEDVGPVGRGGEGGPSGGGGGGHRGGGNGGERRCCLAPERFYGSAGGIADEEASSSSSSSSSSTLPTSLTPEMDVFSLGCVLIELFLNGERALDLGDLMEYRRRGYDGGGRGATTTTTTTATLLPQSLKQKLDKIESSKMRAACRHMLSLDPSLRLSPVEYLERLSSSSTTTTTTTTNTTTNTNTNTNTIGSTRRTIDSVGGGGGGGDESKNERSTHAPVPSCFGSALYPFMLRLRTHILSPDARIALVAMKYGEIVKATVGVDDYWGTTYFSRVIGPTLRRYENSSAEVDQPKTEPKSSDDTRQKDLSVLSMDELLLETENLLRQLDAGVFNSNSDNSSDPTDTISPVAMFDHFPKPLSVADWQSRPSPSQSSIIILLQVVFSSVGHVQRASSKFVALKLMHRIAIFSSDEIRLQRIVPFVTSLLNDSEPIVRASGISVLASVLATVTTFPPSDASIFPRYVFKKVAHLITDSSLIVRVAFAQNIALLAETARRFLDVGHAVRLYEAVAGRHSRDASSPNDSSDRSTALFPEAAANLLGKQKVGYGDSAPSTSNLGSPDTTTTMVTSSYDSDLAVLHEVVFRWVVHITTDTSDHSSQSKQALLRGLPRLCNFFGVEYSFQILPIILAFLNDRKDWQLRSALCRHLPSVCISVGRAATEQFIVPCIETVLNDDVEQVICEALSCLNSLVSLSLLARTSLLGSEIAGLSAVPNRSPTSSRRKKQGVIEKCGPLLLHPSSIVRRHAASLVCMSSQVLGDADSEVIVNQLLKPYLQYKPTFESTHHLLECVKAPSLRKIAAILRPSDNLETEFEISAKLASSLSVPSQKSVELVAKNDFNWYEPLHLAASNNQALSVPIYSLGFASLQKVHDLNIEVPSEASSHILINRMDENRLARHVGNKEDLTDEIITCFLNRSVVQIAESACSGEWGSAAFIDQLVPEISHAHSKILALDVPPLSPSLGLARSDNYAGRHTWCPKEDKLLGSTGTDHLGPVNRLAVSEDQSFFVSASYDGTSKVFELRQAHDSGGNIHSCLTYEGHKFGNDHAPVRINDCCILEHTHSVATAASDGSLHVWRVDTVTSHQNQQIMKRPRVSGHSALRNINLDEGEVLAVSHFNTPSASILAFATQRGHIHSLDIRSAREPFSLNLRPELGYLTDMEVGKDRNWVIAGTSRGYVALWDVRFQTMVKLWRHHRDSPIKRLIDAFGTCHDHASGPLVFIGCDNNEASLFDLSTGGCLQCYRVLDSSLSYVDQLALPTDCLSIPHLDSVNIPSRLGKRLVSLDKALQMTSRNSMSSVSINALAGCINPQGPSYLMTGGTDTMIRLWDLKSASRSCCVSGLQRNQPSPSFEQVGGNSRLIICRQPSIQPSSMVESSKLPMHNRQGAVKCDSRHLDSILDLKVVQNPALLLSASRDHTIKLWA